MDLNEVAALLHVHREASQHGTSLKNIADATYVRLMQINADLVKAPPAPASVEPDTETQSEVVERRELADEHADEETEDEQEEHHD